MTSGPYRRGIYCYGYEFTGEVYISRQLGSIFNAARFNSS